MKSPTDKRRIVIDEELFKVFTRQCYTNKHIKACRKKQKTDDVTYEMIEMHCSKFKNPKDRAPTEETMARMCRQIDWNANYWVNAFRNIYIDPFETFNGLSYYGYTPDLKITNNISPQQHPVDEVFKRHFFKRQSKDEIVKIPENRKRAALDLIRGR